MTTTAELSEPAVTDADDKLDSGVLKVAGVVVLGAIMSILDVTVVSVAQPTFIGTFHTTQAIAAWTMTAYTLALATVIPVSGWAADRFGTKRLYLSSIVVFAGGSALCSIAWGIGPLIGFRVLQGFGGGMLMPLAMTILTRAAGPTRVGRVMAVLGIPMLLGPIGGPILGGWLIQAASWHWIFLINVPIGVVAFIAAFRVLPKDETQRSESFDFLGMALLSPGLALFLYGVSTIPSKHTVANAQVLIPAIVGLALMVGFVLHARRKEHALIDLGLFANRNLTISVITMVLFMTAFMGTMFLLPSYFITVRSASTLSAGLLIAPQGIGAMVTMPIAGRLTDRTGPGKLVLGGIALIVAGLAVFTQVSDHTSELLLLGALFVSGLGMGMTMMPIMSASLSTLTHHQVARGSTMTNIVQQAAGSVGTAVMATILAGRETSTPAGQAYDAFVQSGGHTPITPAQISAGHAAFGGAFGTTYLVGAIIVAICIIPALFLPRIRIAAADSTVDAAPVLVH